MGVREIDRFLEQWQMDARFSTCVRMYRRIPVPSRARVSTSSRSHTRNLFGWESSAADTSRESGSFQRHRSRSSMYRASSSPSFVLNPDPQYSPAMVTPDRSRSKWQSDIRPSKASLAVSWWSSRMTLSCCRCSSSIVSSGYRNSTPARCQTLDHLQPVGQPPGEPVNVGDHQGVPLNHQVQQFQEAAAVVPGSAGFLGSDISQRAAGADQPLHLQVQILVLRLSHRDPGVTVERHPAAPLAGMGKSIPSCQGAINRVFQPPPELRQGGIPSRGRKQGCFQPPPGQSAAAPRPWRGSQHQILQALHQVVGDVDLAAPFHLVPGHLRPQADDWRVRGAEGQAFRHPPRPSGPSGPPSSMPTGGSWG